MIDSECKGESRTPAGLGAPRFDPSRVRAWLVAMTKQGEDQVWRGAEKALAHFDHSFGEIQRLHSLATANNQLARMNGEHRDEWRTKAVRYAEALAPFADALAEWGDDTGQPDRWNTWEHPIAIGVTLGDFRRAASAMETGTAKTEGLGAKHDSAIPQGDAQ